MSGWRQAVHDQLANYALLSSVPELKIVYTQELSKNFRAIQNQTTDLPIDTLEPTEDVLKKLLHEGQFRAAFSLTTKILLAGCAHANPLNIWQVRLHIYIRLGAFNEAKLEIDQFSQLEDLPIQFGQNSTNGGVPFTLLLSVAHLHLLSSCKERAQAKLTKLLQQCTENISYYRNQSNEDDPLVKLWKERELKVYSMMANYGIEQNDFKFAIESMSQLRAKQTDPAEIVESESYLGKVFLQFGDLISAEQHFKEAAKYSQGVQGRLRILKNNALLSIANANYQAAYTAYEEAQGLQPNDPTFVNNMAVCALYMGNSSDGVRLIENALQVNPKTHIDDCTLGNICALYRLQSGIGEAKKNAIKELVIKHGNETLNCQPLDMEI